MHSQSKILTQSAMTKTHGDEENPSKSPLSVDEFQMESFEISEDPINSSPRISKKTIGLILLTVSILCYGSLFPIMAILPGENMLQKTLWRFIANLVTFLPLALLAKGRDGERWTFKKMATHETTPDLIISGVCWAEWLVAVFLAANMYSFMLADLFGNFSSIFILIDRYIKKIKVTRGELCGVGIAIAGAAVIFLTPQENEKGLTQLAIALVLGLSAALAFAINLVKIEKITSKDVPVDVVLFVNTLIGTILILIICLFAGEVEFSFHPTSGVFGILHPQNWGYFFLLSVVCGICSAKTGALSVVYAGPLINSVGYLLAPPIVGIESYLMGVDKMPSIFSWISAVIMIIGLALIILSSKNVKEEKRLIEMQPTPS